VIKEAEKFLGADKAEKQRLFDYYNNNCYQSVDAKRRYKMKPGDNWCAMFTTVIANRCGLSADKFPYEVSVFFQVQKARQLGTFFTDVDKAEPHDLIIYDWDSNGVLDHVGIVVSTGSEYVRVIEGNKSDTVGYRTVSRHNAAIVGFIKTGYKGSQVNTVIPVLSEKERIGKLAKEVMEGKHGDGMARVQSLGADYTPVQSWINNHWH